MDFDALLKLGPAPLALGIGALLVCMLAVGAVYLWILKSTRRARTSFSDDAQRAIGFARVEAENLQSPTIDPTHLLLGLLHSDTSLAALILRERGLRLEPLRAALGGWQSD